MSSSPNQTGVNLGRAGLQERNLGPPKSQIGALQSESRYFTWTNFFQQSDIGDICVTKGRHREALPALPARSLMTPYILSGLVL